MSQPRTIDAALLGLGGMLGAGIFMGLAPAAADTGMYVLIAIVIAALLAMCSAFSTADQSRAYPGPGSGYRYTREQLGRWPGRMAGSLYLAGNLIAIAVIARTLGAYLLPERPTLVAVGAIVIGVAANAVGLSLTTKVNRLLVIGVLLVLIVVCVVCFALPSPHLVSAPAGISGANNPYGLLTASGVMVFAFLGFERITAPSGDAQAHSVRKLHLVIPVVFSVATIGYLLVSFAVLHQLGPVRLALSPAPLRDALIAADGAWIVPVVIVGALAATAPMLVFALSSMQSTANAIVLDGDLPTWLARPKPAMSCFGVLAGVIAVFVPPAIGLGLSVCCLLLYYAFTNAAARILFKEERTWPLRTACFGLGLSVMLGMAMPVWDIAFAMLVVLVGVLGMAGYANKWRVGGYRPERDRELTAAQPPA